MPVPVGKARVVDGLGLFGIVSWSVARSGRNLREGEHGCRFYDERGDIRDSVLDAGDSEGLGDVLRLLRS